MKKIILIGDSIRQGYDRYVKLAFEETAEVFYPKENCRFTSYIIRSLSNWSTEFGVKGEEIDLVHWNAGLWDDLRMADGENLISLDVYRDNIARICRMMKLFFPNAAYIFATSTPVQEHLFTGPNRRLNADTELYNAAACEIVQRHGMAVNDLYATMKNAPVSYHSDLTHYYTMEGTRVITDQVVSRIEAALGIRAKPLDYPALFGKKDDAVGI